MIARNSCNFPLRTDLGPHRDVYCTVWHVRRVEYLVAVCLPGVGVVILHVGHCAVVEGHHGVGLDVLEGEQTLGRVLYLRALHLDHPGLVRVP